MKTCKKCNAEATDAQTECLICGASLEAPPGQPSVLDSWASLKINAVQTRNPWVLFIHELLKEMPHGKIADVALRVENMLLQARGGQVTMTEAILAVQCCYMVKRISEMK